MIPKLRKCILLFPKILGRKIFVEDTSPSLLRTSRSFPNENLIGQKRRRIRNHSETYLNELDLRYRKNSVSS